MIFRNLKNNTGVNVFVFICAALLLFSFIKNKGDQILTSNINDGDCKNGSNLIYIEFNTRIHNNIGELDTVQLTKTLSTHEIGCQSKTPLKVYVDENEQSQYQSNLVEYNKSTHLKKHNAAIFTLKNEKQIRGQSDVIAKLRQDSMIVKVLIVCKLYKSNVLTFGNEIIVTSIENPDTTALSALFSKYNLTIFYTTPPSYLNKSYIYYLRANASVAYEVFDIVKKLKKNKAVLNAVVDWHSFIKND